MIEKLTKKVGSTIVVDNTEISELKVKVKELQLKIKELG